MPPACSIPRGFLVYHDPHKLRKALLEADLALGLSKECPHPPAEIQVLAFFKNLAGGEPPGALQQCQALSQPWACSTQSSLSPSRGHSPELSRWPRGPPHPCPDHSEEARSGSVHTTRKMAGPHPSGCSRKEGRSTAGHTLTHPRLPHRRAQEHRRQPAVETGATRTHRRQRRVTSLLFSLHFRPGV